MSVQRSAVQCSTVQCSASRNRDISTVHKGAMKPHIRPAPTVRAVSACTFLNRLCVYVFVCVCAFLLHVACPHLFYGGVALDAVLCGLAVDRDDLVDIHAVCVGLGGALVREDSELVLLTTGHAEL